VALRESFTHRVSGNRAVGSVDRAALAAADLPWTRRLLHFGYVARGLVYLVPGYLALRLALGTHGAAITQTGAIAYIGDKAHGHGLLLALAVGLAGYSLWGVIRAVLDPLHDGHSAHGVFMRLGYLTSAIAYAGLFAATLRFLTGGTSHVDEARDWTADLLHQPFGPWLLGIVGLCWIAGAGITQIHAGWTATFARDLDSARMSPGERTLALRMGRIGIVARGLVFTLIGILLIAAALHVPGPRSRGLDGALLALSHQLFGRALLAIAAAGLMVFGCFSIFCARWMRVRDSSRVAPSLPPSS
jgi:Domain of Unknown Function (DUF1206)